VEKYAHGKRFHTSDGEVYFKDLQLTKSGEVGAIKQKRRADKKESLRPVRFTEPLTSGTAILVLTTAD